MIRPIEERDYPRFIELAAQLGYPVDPATAEAGLKRKSLRSDETTLVYEDPQLGVVGWIGCRVVDQAYRAPYGDVSGLVVDAAFRSRGYGAELLGAAEDWFRDKGVAEVLVRSGTQREAAHRFYDREGYERYKTQLVVRKSLG